MSNFDRVCTYTELYKEELDRYFDLDDKSSEQAEHHLRLAGHFIKKATRYLELHNKGV